MMVKMEHVLILVIAVFLLYHFVGRCRCMCSGNNFSVGGEKKRTRKQKPDDEEETPGIKEDIDNALYVKAVIDNYIEKKVAEEMALIAEEMLRGKIPW